MTNSLRACRLAHVTTSVHNIHASSQCAALHGTAPWKVMRSGSVHPIYEIISLDTRSMYGLIQDMRYGVETKSLAMLIPKADLSQSHKNRETQTNTRANNNIIINSNKKKKNIAVNTNTNSDTSIHNDTTITRRPAPHISTTDHLQGESRHSLKSSRQNVGKAKRKQPIRQ